MIGEAATLFIENYLGSVAIAAVLVIALFALLMLFFRVPPQYVLIILLPLVGSYAVIGFGVPSWVMILGVMLLGLIIGLFVYTRLT